MTILAFNFLAGVVLIFTLIRRVKTFKPVEWSNFYTILAGLAAGNFGSFFPLDPLIRRFFRSKSFRKDIAIDFIALLWWYLSLTPYRGFFSGHLDPSVLGIADSLIIRGDFERVPVWVISGLLMLGGNLGTISCMYTICTWMEVLDSTSFLVYSGLKSYRGLFWGTSIGHMIVSMALAIVAGINGDLYLLFWRLEWGYWAFMLFGGLSILLVYGS
jgi:hypothetical protein